MNNLVYEISYWDIHQWQRFVELTPQAQEAIAQGQDKIFSFGAFSSEVFSRLYSWDLEPLEKPKPEAEWAVKLHEELSQNQQFQELQDLVGGNYHLSGMAATSFLTELAARLPQPPEPIPDPHELRFQVLGQKRRGEAADQELIAQLIEQGKAAVQQAQDYADSINQRQQIITDSASAASEQLQETIAQIEGMGWGLGEGRDGVGGSIEDKVQLATRIANSPKLRRIAKEAGRLKRVAAAKQRCKSKEARHTIESVETGNDLAHILPSQALMLREPALKPLFVKGYAERSLLQYKMGGKDKMGRGPVVVCLDSSGSMSGSNEIWSKAVCLALLGIAFEQKRHFRLIHFASSVQRTDDFPVAQTDSKIQNRLLRSMEYFSGGGTDWQRALDAALEAIRKDKVLKQADIVLITDGECVVNEDWLHDFKAQQKEYEFSTYGVIIGGDSDRELRRVVDTSIRVANLKDDEAIAEVFSI